MNWSHAPHALGLAATMLAACTIVTEPKHPAPPPPPPPAAPAQPPAATPQPAPPAHTGGTLDPRARLNMGHSGTQPAQPTSADNLVVQVLDGTCEIKIDDQSKGVTNSVKVSLPAGEHVVTCKPEKGELQSYTVAVVEGGDPVTVVFSVTTGAAPRTVPVPPTGRPTPPG